MSLLTRFIKQYCMIIMNLARAILTVCMSSIYLIIVSVTAKYISPPQGEQLRQRRDLCPQGGQIRAADQPQS